MNNLRSLLFSERKSNDSIANRQLKEQSSIITDRYKSPFYEGVVSYGGVSAKRVKLSQASPYNIATKPTIINRIKCNDIIRNDNEQLSNSAKNVLKILEKISSPLEDAKKIPIYSPRSTERYLIDINKPFRKLSSFRTPKIMPSVKTSSPIDSDDLQLKFDNKDLEDTFSSNTFYNVSNSTISQFNYPNDNNGSLAGGKMKSKLFKSRKSIKPEIEHVPENNLPNISLPMKYLPIFNFNINKDLKVNNEETSNRELKRPCISIYEEKRDNNLIYEEFKFSAPKIVKLAKVNDNLSKVNNLKSELFVENKSLNQKIESFDNYASTYSKKNVYDLETKEHEVNIKIDKLETDLDKKQNKTTITNTDAVNHSTNDSPSKGSPASKKWTCDSCFYRNDSLNNCKSCNFPKNKEDNEKKINNLYSNYIFGEINTEKKVFNTFKPTDTKPQNSENSTNLFNNSLSNLKSQNENSLNTHVSSDNTNNSNINNIIEKKTEENVINKTEKETDVKDTDLITDEKEKSILKENKSNTSNSTFNFVSSDQLDKLDNKKSTLNDWKNQFAPDKSNWECSVCLVQNKSTSLKCICCENPNPNSPKTETSAPFINISSSGFQFISSNLKTDEKEFKLTSDSESINKDSNIKTTVSLESTNLSPKIFGTVSSFQPTNNNTTKFSFGSTTATSSISSITTTTNSNWGNKFSLPSENWSCKACCVSNPMFATKCLACDANKETSEDKTEVASTNLFKSPTSSNENKPQYSTSNLFGSTSNNLNKPQPTFKFNDQLPTSLTSGIKSPSKPNEGFKISFTPSVPSTIKNKFSPDNSLFNFGAKSNIIPNEDKSLNINLSTTKTLTNSTATVPTFNFGQTDQIINTSTSSNNFVFGSQTNANLNNGLNLNSNALFSYPPTTSTVDQTINETFKPINSFNQIEKSLFSSSTTSTPSTNSPNLFNSNMTNGFNNSSNLFGNQPLAPTTNAFNLQQQPSLNFSRVPTFNFGSNEPAPTQNNIFQFAAKMDGAMAAPPAGRSIRRARRRLG